MYEARESRTDVGYIADLWYRKGLTLSNLERYNEAIECFDKAIEKDPDFADAWHNRGVSLGNLERYNEAIECFDKAIAIFEESGKKECDLDAQRDLADIMRKKGFALGRTEEHAKAKECFDKSIRIYQHIRNFDRSIDIDFAFALNSRGYYFILYPSLKKYEKEAVECFDQAIQIRPDFAYPWYNKGFVLSKLGEYDKAIEIFYNSIKTADDPNYSSLAYAMNNKGYALNSLERFKEAVECFDQAMDIYKVIKRHDKDIDIDPDLVHAWYNKGYALNSLGKYNEAIKCFDKAIEIKNSDQDIAYLRRGQSKYMLDDYPRALDDFKKINDNDPSYVAEKHNNIGLCYHKQGSIKQAKEEYGEATKSNLESTRATAYYNLGVLYDNENNRNAAKRMFENCLKIHPAFSKAKEAIKKFEGSEQSEWYDWWFSHHKGKKVLGVLLIVSILSPLLIGALIVYDEYFISHHIIGLTSFIKQNVSVLLTGVLSIMGLSIAVLLLPSLTKIKVGSVVELETVSITHAHDVKLETFVRMPSLKFVSMPMEIPLQTFRMPLQSLRMPNKYPLKSTRMPLPCVQAM